MDKLLAIIKREYLTRVKSKGFIIGTILTPLLMAGIAFLPMLLFGKGERNTYRLVVLDQTDDATLYQRAEKFLTEKNDRGDRFQVTREVIAADQLEARQQQLNQEIKTDKLGGYVIFPTDVLESGKILQRAKNVNDFSLLNRIRNAFNQAVIEQRMMRAGISPEKVSAVSKDIQIDLINDRGEQEAPMSKFWLPFLLSIILYI